MKTLILYFSGTGNTYFIAEKIKNELCKKEQEVYLSSVEKFDSADVDKFDILILGYPVYACDMPIFLQEYINKLTVPKTKYVVLFSTMGFYEGNASSKIARRLMKIGMIPIHSEGIRMPGSDGMIFMKKESRYIQKVLSMNFNGSKDINKSVNNIINKVDYILSERGNEEKVKYPFLKFGGIIAGSFMNMIYKIIEKNMKQKFWVDDKCTNCHLCHNICPASNIVIENEKVVFLDKCYLCMRCVNRCPKESIQIGMKTKGKFRWKGPSGKYKGE